MSGDRGLNAFDTIHTPDLSYDEGEQKGEDIKMGRNKMKKWGTSQYTTILYKKGKN